MPKNNVLTTIAAVSHLRARPLTFSRLPQQRLPLLQRVLLTLNTFFPAVGDISPGGKAPYGWPMPVSQPMATTYCGLDCCRHFEVASHPHRCLGRVELMTPVVIFSRLHLANPAAGTPTPPQQSIRLISTPVRFRATSGVGERLTAAA